jgi:hypothetical protein
MWLLFGIPASAVIMPQNSDQKLLKAPSGRRRENLVSSMSRLIVKFRFDSLFSLLCVLFFFLIVSN